MSGSEGSRTLVRGSREIIMKLTVALWATLCCVGTALAQPGGVTIRVAPPPPNMYRVGDLWRGDIVNSSTTTYRVVLRGIVDELLPGNERVIVARSRQFDLPPGVLRFTGRDLEPFTTESYAPSYYDMVFRSGTVPSGEYRGCTEVVDVTSGAVLAEFCNDVVIENTSQPFLLAPAHDVELGEPYPVFSWLGASPATTQRITYRIRIAEQFVGQTPQDALQRNPSFLDVSSLDRTVFMYPISARRFTLGQRYAWCVTAYEQRGSALRMGGISEVWSFVAGAQVPDSTSTSRPTALPVYQQCAGENWDFEIGSTSCWTAEGDLVEVLPVRGSHPELGRVQHHREWWYTTYGDVGDGLTGSMRSDVFIIQEDEIRLRVGGSGSPDACVELVVEGTDSDTLRGDRRRLPGLAGSYIVVATTVTSTVRPQEVLQSHTWDVASLRGRRAAILVRDWSRSAHVNVDRIERTRSSK